MKTSINDVADYIITLCDESGEYLSHLKLQKLLYYTQAWYLAFYNEPLFKGKFQAWVHGPVNRDIYNRFSSSKSLYSSIDIEDIRSDFDVKNIPSKGKKLIESVLETYGSYTGAQLEEMTHDEKPWKEARKGYRPSQRCEEDINEKTMQQYYAKRIEE